MAKAHLNTALNGIGGKIDGYVYRRYRGATVIQREPVFTKPWSEGQGKTRATFSGGSAFAAAIKADPALRELYRARGKEQQLNYRQVAIRDYFHAPAVDSLDPSGYTAASGGALVAIARDDFEVVRVTFALHDANAALVAHGEATLRHCAWHFTAPPTLPGRIPPVTVTVTAYDRPGNSAVRTFPLP